ncbi:MAG: WecB/TagA/CpsF family glycosyltransferase [Proteobacteria bacterium]|nr:WecB/TagA/CpsF family glycosyltransferase [Pseudomonadota bacterium]
MGDRNADCRILGTRVDPTSLSQATRVVLQMVENARYGYVCAANVHMIMEGYDSPEFQDMVNGADIVTPDGMPLVWMLKGFGFTKQQRVYGPDLMLHVCAAAEKAGIPVGFLGSAEDVLDKLKSNLELRYGDLRIVYMYSPPFRPLSSEEVGSIAREVKNSGAQILFIGLGCPKQEIWMAKNKGKVPAVMLGVGAAFDFHAGTLPNASQVLKKLGLEWLFRLSMEPKRLWKRYVFNNPRFVALSVSELIKRKFG